MGALAGNFEEFSVPTTPGRCGWFELLDKNDRPLRLESIVNTDFLIIGAGWAGLAAAAKIREQRSDARVVVVEAEQIGQSSAGRNSGFMIDVPHRLMSSNYAGSVEADRFEMEANRIALAYVQKLCAHYNLSRTIMNPVGKINAYIDQKFSALNNSYARHLEKLGEKFELFDRQKMREITGTDIYSGGLYTPGTVLIQPAQYLRELARALEKDNVKIFEDSPVQGFHRSGEQWVFETKKGKVLSPKVILAVNGMVEKFGYFPDRLVHTFGFSAMTRPIDDIQGSPNWGIMPTYPLGTAMRRVSDSFGSRILLHGRFTYSPDMRLSELTYKDATKALRAAFERRYPQYKKIEFEYVWAGRACFSSNGAPAFGKIDDGLFSACCQNGIGSTKGSLSGLLAAEMALGESSTLLDRFLALGRPKKLPAKPFRSFRVNSYLSRKSRAARGE